MSSIPPVFGGSRPDYSGLLKDRWIPGVRLALYALGTVVSILIDGQIETVTYRVPGVGAWYFVQQDFIQGACMLVSLLVSVAIAAVFWRRYPLMAFTSLALQFFNVQPVATAAVGGGRRWHRRRDRAERRDHAAGRRSPG
jgi:hypothetical protein